MALIGVYIQFVMCKGFFGIIILTLKTVVDERAANISVSFALLSVNLNILITSYLLGALESFLSIDLLLLIVPSIPQVFTIVIFIYVGF